METSITRALLVLFIVLVFGARPAAGSELGWQPEKTWVFAVGVLSWKHSDIYGSFPVKGRRDNALVDFFRQRGVRDSQVVYLQDKQATQERIDAAFTEQLKKLRPDDLLIVYYAGHGTKSDDGNDVYLASYDAGDDEVDGWSVNSIPGKINASKCGRVLWLIDCCYSGQAGLAIARQLKGRPYAAVTSSAASESSTEHWTFTEALLDALRGVSYVDLNHDGAVTLAEFAAHVEADMNAAEEQRSTFEHTKGFDPEMALAAAKPLSNPRIGERAKARDSNGDLYACRIIDARDQKFRIHFIGYEDDEDVWVAPEDLEQIKAVAYAKGTKVEVLWKKSWYAATVLQAKDGVHLIHYTDYDAKWDEWVPSRRIRAPE
jgi:Caspase domain/RNA binding activity-knot of a chromodomain